MNSELDDDEDHMHHILWEKRFCRFPLCKDTSRSAQLFLQPYISSKAKKVQAKYKMQNLKIYLVSEEPVVDLGRCYMDSRPGWRLAGGGMGLPQQKIMK